MSEQLEKRFAFDNHQFDLVLTSLDPDTGAQSQCSVPGTWHPSLELAISRNMQSAVIAVTGRHSSKCPCFRFKSVAQQVIT